MVTIERPGVTICVHPYPSTPADAARVVVSFNHVGTSRTLGELRGSGLDSFALVLDGTGYLRRNHSLEDDGNFRDRVRSHIMNLAQAKFLQDTLPTDTPKAMMISGSRTSIYVRWWSKEPKLGGMGGRYVTAEVASVGEAKKLLPFLPDPTQPQEDGESMAANYRPRVIRVTERVEELDV